MNLLGGRAVADYVNTGEWSKKSIKEAKKYCTVNVAASSEDKAFTYVPPRDDVEAHAGRRVRAHLHQRDDRRRRVPLDAGHRRRAARRRHVVAPPVARRSTSRKYGVIYGGAQKNIGPAGLTIVIVRDDLLDRALPITPSAFHWKEQAEADSMLNTPPTYAIYIAGLVFEWLLAQGGLAGDRAGEHRQGRSCSTTTSTGTEFYRNPVRKEDRSRMNVPFKLRDDALDEPFLKGAKERGMVQLKGHRSVGGMRASIYNAMPIEGVRDAGRVHAGVRAQHG